MNCVGKNKSITQVFLSAAPEDLTAHFDRRIQIEFE